MKKLVLLVLFCIFSVQTVIVSAEKSETIATQTPAPQLLDPPSTPRDQQLYYQSIINTARWQYRKNLIAPNYEKSDFREENITDVEVRQLIKELKQEIGGDIDDSLVSIGPVIEGCACEGASCTHQVYLSYETKHTLFSKYNDNWELSRRYDVWKEYDKLMKQYEQQKTLEERMLVLDMLADLFQSNPQCKS